MPLLSTVKSKTAATSAPSASASTAPASQAPASQAPSAATDVSAAPSADPSAVPSADVSASPSADVSAEPSVEPSKEPSVVSQIILKDGDALTNTAGTRAYVYYDVLDQYGESMRTQADIQWTTSPAGGKADKTTGRIEIKKNATETEKFTYGEQIYVVGVHTKTGTNISQSVKVGMAQAVDTIKIAGFVSKNDTATILETLPKNFSKDTYYMVFKTYDQNGNPLDVTEEEYGMANLSIISGNPLYLSVDKDTTKVFNVKGDDYAGVMVQPGTYVDRGGEVKLTIVATKTGTKKEETIVIGALPQLKSLELLTPKGTVADGDQNVEIPFKALDTEGNEVTAYETIVRSSNTLSLNASEGTLKLAEQDDGTAKITWSDKYDPEDPESYATSTATDGFARPVNLMTIVIGGESIPTTLSVEDIRIPAAISATNLPDYLANKATISAFPMHSLGQKNYVFSFKDQYGSALATAKADAFFEEAGLTGFGSGSDKKYYGVRMISTAGTTNSKLKFLNTDDDWTKWNALDSRVFVYSINGEGAATWSQNMQFKADNSTDAYEETLKFSIVTSASKTAAVGDWNDESKIVSQTITTVPVKKLTNLSIGGLTDTYEVEAMKSSARVEAGPTDGEAVVLDSADFANAGEIKFQVKGLYKGNSVDVPFGAGFVTEGTNSDFEINDTDSYGWNPLGNLQTAVTNKQLFDYKTYGNPAKDVTFEAAVAVLQEGGTSAAELAKAQAALAASGSSKAAKVVLEKAVAEVASGASVSATASGAAVTAEEAYDDLTDYTDDDAVDAVVEAYNTVKTKDVNLTALVKAVTDAIADVVTAAKAEKALADAETSVTTLRKDVTISADPRTTKKLDYKTAVTINPEDLEITGAALLGKATATAKSQYGDTMTETIVYTISDYKEETASGLTHVDGGVEIVDNGSSSPSITGAEIGDTFKVTAKVQGKAISAECTVTVGADKSAFIGYGTGNDNSDKTFREKKLGYVSK